MQTTLFDWAASKGLTLADLAARLGYSERHLMRIRDGEYPVNEQFAGRVVLRLGDWSRSLFLPPVSVENVKTTRVNGSDGEAA
jgi:transcriptional regulator with XRE-family HTH domain